MLKLAATWRCMFSGTKRRLGGGCFASQTVQAIHTYGKNFSLGIGGEIFGVRFNGRFIAALAVCTFGSTWVLAQQTAPSQSNLDPNGYYNPFDPNGYFDRNGQYHLMRPGNPVAAAPGQTGATARAPARTPAPASRTAQAPAPPPPPVVEAAYAQGRYEADCRRDGPVAGTIFPSTGGGLFGGEPKGKNGEITGGAVMSGALQRAIALRIECDNQATAFGAYAAGLDGDLNKKREWRHGDQFGEFTSTREFRRADLTCREFVEMSYRTGTSTSLKGTACRSADGNWRFD
jgi:surface antigen